MKYRFPCERCGEKLVIDVSQAGRQINCRCGAALEVPSLRAIRALETAPDDSVKLRRPSWNLGRGVMFAGGLVIALLGLLAAGAGGFGWLTAQAPPSPSPSDIEAALTVVDQLSAPRAWDLWAEMRTNGLGQYFEPPQSVFEAFLRRVQLVVFAGVVILAVGLAAMVSSIFLPGRTRRV
jgi:hypothetical protein